MSRLAGSRAGRWASFIWGGFALGCGVAFAAPLSGASVIPVTCAAGGCLLICAAVAPRSIVVFGIVTAAIVLGVLRGAAAVTVPGPGSIDGHLGTRPVVIEGTVRSADPGSGTTAIIDASHLSDADTDGHVSGGVLVSGPLIPALSPGDTVEINAAGLRPLDRRPGANSAATLERDGVEAMATSPQVFVIAAGPAPLMSTYAATTGRATSRVRRRDHSNTRARALTRPMISTTFNPETTTMWISPAS